MAEVSLDRNCPRASVLKGISAPYLPDQWQAQIPPWRQGRSPHHLRVEAFTLAFDKLVEPALDQQLVQPFVKGMPRGPRQLPLHNPELSLRLPLLCPSSHRHARSVRSQAVNRSTFFVPTHPDFHQPRKTFH